MSISAWVICILTFLIFVMATVTWRYSDLYYRRSVRDRFYNEIDGRYIKLLAIFPQIINLTKEMEAVQAGYINMNNIFKLFDNGAARVQYLTSIRQQVFDVLVDYAEIRIYISRLKIESQIADKKVIKDLLQDLENTIIGTTRDNNGFPEYNFDKESSMFSECIVGQHLAELRKQINKGDFDVYLFNKGNKILRFFLKPARPF
ncbi:hypothetical protein HAP94_24990 [Acidithiobacillus ferrivorans]|nr:hypothetical protein [Acidithiobacillus ferrivorans]